MNVIRVLFMHFFTGKWRKKKEKYQDEQVKTKRLDTDFELYESYPFNHDEYIVLAGAAFYFLIVVAVISFIPLNILIYFAVHGEDIFLNILTVVSMILFIISLMIFAKYLQHYMEHTGCYYHLDYVFVKRYHRKDYKMTYEELEKNITKRKIIVRNGRVELPYKYGRIPLYTCGEPVSAGLFRYINKKCHTKIPEMDQRRMDIVRRAGLGSVICKVLGIPFLCIFTYWWIIASIMDNYQKNMSIKTMLGIIIRDIFTWNNIILDIGLFIIAVGLILKVFFYFPAHREFKNCRKFMKVR